MSLHPALDSLGDSDAAYCKIIDFNQKTLVGEPYENIRYLQKLVGIRAVLPVLCLKIVYTDIFH